MKIIAVDDESDALSNFLLTVLDTDLEYKMFRDDPLSTLEYVKDNTVDAAFLDINMPQINGVDLAQKLINSQSSIKIVFISGYVQDEQIIKARLGGNLIGFCYKPYTTDTLFNFLRQIAAGINASRRICLRAFGAFELLINDIAVKFSSSKSKELLALLIEKNGSHLTMSEAISCLWPDKNADYAKILYRDAVWRLRRTLKESGLESLVEFTRAQQIINKKCAQCDYWDFLDGKNTELYSGTYMPNFEWSIETQNKLDIRKSHGATET